MIRLVILVSDEFRRRLDKAGPSEFQLGEIRLLVHKGEKQWLDDDGLRDELLALLKTRQERSVRIVAHLSGCLKRECDQSPFQVRALDLEDEMKRKAGMDDLEIWGFKHEIKHSKIWNVLSKVRAEIAGPGLQEPVAAQLGGDLDRAFSQALAQNAYEQVTVTRHQILGLFVSARLSLEVAAERGKGGAMASLERMRTVLPAKKAEALQILDDRMTLLNKEHTATSRKLAAERIAVADVLDNLPTLDAPESASAEFNAWLSRLDEFLEQLRRGCH